MFTRILICGSRDFGEDREAGVALHDTILFNRSMDLWVAKHGLPEVLIEGCARGADSMAGHWWAGPHQVRVEHFPADWNRHGRAAGPIRNQQMLDEGTPQAVIAFTHDLRTSRGTRDMVTRARRAGLPVWLPIRGSDDPTAR